MAVIDDERLRNVENEKEKAVQEAKNTYGQMINESDKYYQAQIDAAKQYEKTQTDLQNQQTQLTVDEINQQKEKAQKEYQREQRGAYADYQKATGQYGVNEEQLAAQGLNRTGYAESTRTNAYNTYQNRYATARESYNNAVLNYDNSIKEARLSNNVALANIAYQTLQTQLELSLQGFQYKNTLIQTQRSAVNEEIDRYNNQYQQVLNQINTENALAEQIRQYNETMAFNREKEQEAIRQYNETMAFNKQKEAQDQANWEKQYALSLASSRSSGGGSSRSSGSGSSGGGYTLTDTSSNNYEVNTQYYQGNLNEDAKNGTFSNGYQPDNITYYDSKLDKKVNKKLKKTGETLDLQTQTLSGENKTVTQNVWSPDGGKTKYYWDGRKNQYIKL